jgi:hypothetical protein
MARCEDYPCCGHGPAPHGDGGGCPDSRGRFECVLCHARMRAGATSSICPRCLKRQQRNPDYFDAFDREQG